MQKKAFSCGIDRNNRLVLNTPKGKVAPEGKFSADSKNRLAYLLNEPSSWRIRYEVPSKIISQGRWSLNRNYDLVLRYRAAKAAKYRDLVLKGNIIKSGDDTFIFEVAGANRDNLTRPQLITLNGIWRADKNNRIEFLVKNRPDPDRLVLGTDWKMGDNNQIVYQYEKRSPFFL